MKTSSFFLAVFLLLSCGGEGERLSFPDPLPLTASDTTFALVTGGTFITSWGDTVEIHGFRLGRYEVSNRLYYYQAGNAGIGLPPDPGFPGMDDYIFNYPDYPAVNMSMNEASAIAQELGGRLPTRAEWEYAAKLGLTGDVSGQYPWGSLDPHDAEYPTNYLAGDEWESRDLDGYLWTAPIDSFPLTDAGFACLSGNVAEWTQSVDSVVPVCGGSWLSPESDLVIGSVRFLPPGDRAGHIGFRILLPEL